MSTIDASLEMPSERFSERPTEGVQFNGSRFLFNLAAREFGVELTDQEDNDWRALMGGAYFVDHLLDVAKDDVEQRVADLASGHLLGTMHEDTQERFRGYLLRQPEARYNDILHRLGEVSFMAQRQASAQTAREVIDVRREEADLLAYLLALPIDGRPDAAARQRFNDWLLGWSHTGYLLDSFFDMDLDYANGDSGLRPTLRSRASVGAATLKEMAVAARKTPPKLLGQCAMVGFRYFILNKKPDMTDLTRAQ